MIDGLTTALIDTSRDVFAVSALLLGFQYLVLRQPLPHLRRLLGGLVLVIVAPVFWAIGSILAGRMRLPRGLTGTALQMLTGGGLLSIAGVVRGERITEMPTLGVGCPSPI